MGPRSVPLWLPRPEYDGMLAHDATPSYDAGLVTRPLADTARDTLAWLRATPDATRHRAGRARRRPRCWPPGPRPAPDPLSPGRRG